MNTAPHPVLVTLEPDLEVGHTQASFTIYPDEATARADLAQRTLVGWLAVRIEALIEPTEEEE